MDLQIPPTLLSPRERTTVIAQLNRVMRRAVAFKERGFIPLAVTAYPHVGADPHSVRVVVVIDRPLETHADMFVRGHESRFEKASDRVRMEFMDTAQAALDGRFDFGVDIVSERLLIDPYLEAAAAEMRDPNAVSNTYFCALQQLRALGNSGTRVRYDTDGNRDFAAREREVMEEVVLAAAVRSGTSCAAGPNIELDELLRNAMEAFPTYAGIDDVSRRWSSALNMLQFRNSEIFDARITPGFRKARIEALKNIPEAHELDAKAAATAVLLAGGGTRPIAHSLRSQLVAALASQPAPRDSETEEFLL